MTEYFNVFEKTQYMTFLMKAKELLEKHKLIWSNLEKMTKKKVDTQPS